MKLYPQYRTWRAEGLRSVDGILVATDMAQEWLLPWWWDHYSKHNDYPVAFVDFGMSEEKKKWCLERGEFIPLRIADVFVTERKEIEPSLAHNWAKIYGINQWWSSRNAWFKKPFACLQSPFRRTLWLDLDCEIRGSVASLFPLSDHSDGIALHQERLHPFYNGGVISFRHGIRLFEIWASECLIKTHQFASDQEILSQLTVEQKITVKPIPDQMNWLFCYGTNPNAVIFHWCGDKGHNLLRRQIEIDALSKNSSFLDLIARIK